MDTDEEQRSAVEKRLHDEGIETVLCVVPDLWGRLMGKRVTTDSFLKTALRSEGLHASLYLFVVDMDMDPRPGYELSNWRTGFSDFRMVPDLTTFRLAPWLDKTAIVICDGYEEDSDQLVEVAPRSILRRQLDRAAAENLRFKTAAELEFYLYKTPPAQAWASKYTDLEPLSYYRSDYHILQSSRDDHFIEAIRRHMNAADIEVEFSKSEWGLGQQEINLRYAEALEMADRHALYKNGVKEMAQANELERDVHGQARHLRHRIFVPHPRQRLGHRGQREDGRPVGTARAFRRRTVVPRRAARAHPGAVLAVRAERQLLQALPERVLRPHRRDLGTRQPRPAATGWSGRASRCGSRTGCRAPTSTRTCPPRPP